MLPHAEFKKELGKFNTLFHLSWIQESYGLLIDECKSLGMNIICVANPGGFSDRVENIIDATKGYQYAYEKTMQRLQTKHMTYSDIIINGA